jgi:polyphosphate glucokinase
MVSDVKELTSDWTDDVVSIGYPGPVLRGRVIAEPYNLGRGWIGSILRGLCLSGKNHQRCRDASTRLLRGRMLFLGLGTGMCTAMIIDGLLEPMELGHLPYKKSTYEDYVGRAGLERDGKKK